MYQFGTQPDQSKTWSPFSAFGIPIHIEIGYLLFAGFVYLVLSENSTPVEIALIELVIFLSLIFHELGHALASRWAGCNPRSIRIVLKAFGGYATHEPTTRGKSLIIVLAGPACTALLILIGFIAMNIPALKTNYPGATEVVFGYLMLLNVIWFIFNMLPVYPMDGGQALFHALSFRIANEQALVWTARISIATSIIGALIAWRVGFVFATVFLVFSAFQNFQILQLYGRGR